MLTLSGAGQPQNGKGIEKRFIISVKTDNAGTSSDNEFTLPWIGTYDIDWGDGNADTGVVDTQTHTYASAGTYDVKVKAATGRVYFNNGGDKSKVIDIKNWGTCAWTTMHSAFKGCDNLDISAVDIPNLTNINSTYSMFDQCTSLIGNNSMGLWDVSNVTSMQNMFYRCGLFNIDISAWDMSNVTNIVRMFYMNGVVGSFNQPIGNWDVGNLVNAQSAFEVLKSFNYSLGDWDISNVTSLRGLFEWTPINTGMDVSNYNDTLIKWAAQTPQNNVQAHFGSFKYTYEAAAARQTLIDTYGWTITDGGQAVAPEFAISVKTDNSGTSNDDQFTISWVGTYDIDWGDGVIETGLVNTQTHTYASVGTYNVKVTASSGSLRFRNNNDGKKLIAVKNWGTCVWTSFRETFFACYSLTELPLGDIPNLSQVTNFLSTFYDCRNLENWGTISEWDFSNATLMAGTFSQASRLVSEISNFNISNWDFSNVTDLRLMYIFYQNGVQTADIGNPNNWNVSNVTTLTPFTGYMNIDTSTWNLSSWDISSATNVSPFSVIGLTPDNYDATLISWAAQPVNNNITCNFGSSKYTLGGAAEAARNILINTYNWTITDAGGVYKPVSGLLFDYPNPTSAYSLRSLASFQGGVNPAVVRVRRSSDNLEQDFTSVEIIDGTLTSFTGANDGFVVKIYDQSYELQHIYQNTATRQAKIVDAGSLILEGGLPCIQPAGGYRTVSGENLNYYTNKDTFTYHLQKPDGAAVANNEFFIDSAGGAEYGREGFSFGNNYARINYPYGSTISSISYSRNLTDDIYQPLVWESYPSSLILNNRLKLYNKTGLLADGNTSNTTPTGQGSTRIASFFAAEGGTFRTLEGNWQETILYKEENIPNRDNFLTSISEYYNFPATSGLLFEYPGASAAYSLRNLADNVTNVVRVRRSSDNTEQDFTSAEITDGTLAAFTGANDGFVTTWYDQSGNSDNAVQATAINQPKIVENGVVLLSNNKPSLRFREGFTKRYFNHPLTNELNSSFSILSVVKADVTGSAYEGLFNTDTMMVLARVNNGTWGTFPSGVTSTNLYTNTINLATMISSDGNTGDFYTNNNSDSSFTDTDGQDRNSIGGIGNQEFTGFISEMIIYPIDQSANRDGIETNINTEYTIY